MTRIRTGWSTLRDLLARWHGHRLEADGVAIVRLVEPAMRGWCRAVCDKPQDIDIDDDVANALEKLFKSELPAELAEPAGWARSVLMSVLRDKWRKAQRRRKLAATAVEKGGLVPDRPVFSSAAAHPPANHVAADELARALGQFGIADRVIVLLDALPAWLDHDDALWLAERAGLSEIELSTRLSLRPTRAECATLYFGAERTSPRLTDRFRKALERAKRRAAEIADADLFGHTDRSDK